MDSFIYAVLDDIADQIACFSISHIPTVYIGGGTPSVLGAQRMEYLLTGLNSLIQALNAVPAEFTVEANPESADSTFLQACINGGVTRISLGVQSFHDPSRRAVHREGNKVLLEERIALTSELFPGAFSADLITGLPLQSMAVLENDIHRLLSFRPAHVSLYSLIVEPPCSGEYNSDEADNLWIAGRDMLENSGFAQYEVSNFALPHKACTHNIRYWRMENWLGAGPAASGTIIDERSGTGRRSTYQTDVQAYLAAPRPRFQSALIEELSRCGLIRESLLMGFRYRGGPCPQSFVQRFKCRIEDCIPQTISRWRRRDFFDKAGSLAPSREGLLFLNGFLSDAFTELSSLRP